MGGERAHAVLESCERSSRSRQTDAPRRFVDRSRRTFGACARMRSDPRGRRDRGRRGSTTITKVETGQFLPTLETVWTACGGPRCGPARASYPSTGRRSTTGTRCESRELLLGELHARWQRVPKLLSAGPRAASSIWRLFDPQEPHARGDRARFRPATGRAAPPLERGEGGVPPVIRSVADAGPARAGPRFRGCSSCARHERTGRSRLTRVGSCAMPIRRIRATRSSRSGGRLAGLGPALLWARLDDRPCRDLERRLTQLEASTAPRASANGSRLAAVKPATLIRPRPTT